MNDLPDDLAKPGSDHSGIATAITGVALLLIIAALVVWVVVM
jgi:hypothetical protein